MFSHDNSYKGNIFRSNETGVCSLEVTMENNIFRKTGGAVWKKITDSKVVNNNFEKTIAFTWRA